MHPIIARKGFPIIGIIFCSVLVLFLLSCIAHGHLASAFRIGSLAGALFLFFSLYFFRDPERNIPHNRKVLLSPADGTIIDIREMSEPLYLKTSARRVSIFMSVFNVHVNRSPVNGTIEYMHYNPGKFISAFKDKASDENESMLVGIQRTAGSEKIAVKFIAGLIARRIVFYNKLKDKVGQGERINMIRFGSRVDIFCPLNAEIKVKNGDKVTAGITVIAALREQ
ncbi:MAG: phosphatidylserine decarboxylase family protein [Pseudomonadota bacterium]